MILAEKVFFVTYINIYGVSEVFDTVFHEWLILHDTSGWNTVNGSPISFSYGISIAGHWPPTNHRYFQSP